MKYNVLILGGGGREHALVRAIRKSPLLNRIYITKTDSILCREAEGVDLNPLDNSAVKGFADQHDINLIIPGSEVYLANGIADVFSNSQVIVFGPNKYASQIETSKSFAKELMIKYHIPTASSQSFTDYDAALSYVDKQGVPIVIKYDGLAAGKGVVVAFDIETAKDALANMLLDKDYGDASVLIEEYLEGEEFSYISLVNGELFAPLPISKDYKRLNDDDQGPNTGGMGACSPVDFVNKETEETVKNEIIKPILSALKLESITYCGFLYAGLILTKTGPKVIEFNARLGDPETEVILDRLTSDLLQAIIDIMNGLPISLDCDDLYHLGVVMAAKGYPKSYEKNHEIKGKLADDFILHMGVKYLDGRYYSDGGRVLFVKAKAETLAEAKRTAYELVREVECDNLIYRNDIGKGVENG